ncbi:MAG: hypothetical protein ACI4IT_05840 [Oscillospiraceae bacterium]
MSKYLFNLPPKIKRYIEYELEHFNENKRWLKETEDNMMPRITPTLSFVGGGGGVNKSTEKTAIKIASSIYIRRTEENIRALERVFNKLDNTDKMLIELVYFRKTHTVIGAGLKVNLDKSAAYRHINNILGLIALEMGLITHD